MTNPTDLELVAGEPLSLLASPRQGPAALVGARVEKLEFSCRGDRVPCMLAVPPGEGPFPLALLQQRREENDDGDLLTALARAHAFVDAGCGLAAIDLPLEGSRRSPKLSELLADTLGRATRGDPIGEASELLWLEFTRQATLELRRTLDLIGAVPTIDAERIGYVGIGVGGFVGAVLCGVDRRPAAVVLGGAGSGIAPAAIAPESFVPRIAPRPLLLLNDPEPAPGGVSRKAAEQLHDAAREPNQVRWSSGPNTELAEALAYLKQSLRF